MGSSDRADEALARQGIVAQRLAQGIRNYLTGLLATKSTELSGSYEAETKDGITSIDCEFLCDEKVPFKSVRFTMEFEHR